VTDQQQSTAIAEATADAPATEPTADSQATPAPAESLEGAAPTVNGAPGMAAWQAMVAAVPEAGADSGSILRQLAAADSPEALNTPWENAPEDLEQYLGACLRFDAIARAPSDFKEGLGFYLIVEATDGRTGAALKLTTGSVNVCAQLVRAYVMGWLPRWAIVEQSEKPTKRGNYPQRLRFVSATAAAALNGDAD